MEIHLPNCSLVPWREKFAAQVAQQANDYEVKRHLRESFPHPYTLEHANKFIASAQKGKLGVISCILVEGRVAGSMGFRPGEGAERFSAEMGYWLGREFWGRGIGPAAIRAMTDYAVDQHSMRRLFALIDQGNQPSMRACEKAGYHLEARLQDRVFKYGKFMDQIIYAYIAEG